MGAATSASSHRHSAVQFVRCRDTAVRFRIAGHTFDAGAAIVGADVEHSFEASGGVVELFLVEPSGPFGRTLNEFASRRIGVDLASSVNDRSAPPVDPDERIVWGRALLAGLDGVDAPRSVGAWRREVSQAVRLVVVSTGSVPRLTDVAAHVGLSPRQLSRSFAEQVGMPFRRFIVWNRVRRAVLALRSGHDLTTAAASAGFADSMQVGRRPCNQPFRSWRTVSHRNESFTRGSRSAWATSGLAGRG